MKGLLFRDSCFSCNFSQKNRSSDITVCDYWGYENHHNQFAPKKGISAILINTEKGEDLFNQARAYLELEESGVDKIASGNGNLKASSSKPANREKFLADRKMFEYEQLGKSYMKCEKLLVYKVKQMIPGCVKDMIKNIRRKLR